MKRETFVPAIGTLALCLSLNLAACSKNKPSPAAPSQPNNPQQPVEAPAWKLAYKADCNVGEEGEGAGNCVAYYGFSISANGEYQIGPSPSNKVKTGKVTPEELQEVTRLIEAGAFMAQIDANAADICTDREDWESSDSIVLTRQQGERAILTHKAEQICFLPPAVVPPAEGEGASATIAALRPVEALHSALKSLASRYYATPFPDLCQDSADTVTALYGDLQSCQQDSDCVYVSNTYSVIYPGSTEFVVTDDCSKVAPIVVGNVNLVLANEIKLQTARSSARDACGQDLVRFECTGVTGFESSVGAPVCVQNKCQINPAAVPGAGQ